MGKMKRGTDIGDGEGNRQRGIEHNKEVREKN